VAQTCGGYGSAIGAGDAFRGECGAPVAAPLSTTTSPDGLPVPGSDVYQTLRFEPARATVAASRSAVEEETASATTELRRQDPHLASPANVVGLDID
jgi:hypothetical protein